MATNTSRLGLLKKDPVADGNDTFNIKTMLNDNWDKIDGKVATLGADGKVPADQLSITVSDASTTQKGVVMLEDSVTSASVTKAATPKSVKTVSDALDAHKTDYVSHPGTGTTSNAGNAYAVTLNPAPTSYIEKMGLVLTINADSTGASTINVNGLGAKAIKKANGNAVTNLKANGVYTLRYSGGNFILQGEGGEYGTATVEQVLEGYTLGTENGVLSGVLKAKKFKEVSYVLPATLPTLSFVHLDDSTRNQYYISITDIGFQPTALLAYIDSGSVSLGSTLVEIQYVDVRNSSVGYVGYLERAGSITKAQSVGSQYLIKIGVGNALFNSDNITLPLPMYTGNQPIKIVIIGE